jgi:hypothetical protein
LVQSLAAACHVEVLNDGPEKLNPIEVAVKALFWVQGAHWKAAGD